jgi:hypothetical protein
MLLVLQTNLGHDLPFLKFKTNLYLCHQLMQKEMFELYEEALGFESSVSMRCQLTDGYSGSDI